VMTMSDNGRGWDMRVRAGGVSPRFYLVRALPHGRMA